ncbi:MAG: ABC transporter permease [Gemmatimonadaceae bacterium]|nr:ABC transporter permease [Gemmatimonadaceae bacterium]
MDSCIPCHPIVVLTLACALGGLPRAIEAQGDARAQVGAGRVEDVSPAPAGALRTIAVDERLVADRGVRLGDTLTISATPGGAGERVVVGAIVRRAADPSEVARAEYRVRLHLDHLQSVSGAGDRVDRFAVAVTPGSTDAALAAINARSFGFRAHRSSDVAAQASRTFAVVSRFNRAIGVISIVASAIFLLCIMLLKVEERRRDVAALRLLGISRRTVTGAVVIEASCIALLGSAAGVAFGYVASAIINAYYRGLYRTPLAFSMVTPGTVGFAVLLSLALGIGAGFLAARRLTGVPPLSLFGR